MRVLFTFVGGRGHFEPLAPIARAALAAGHDVAFASGSLIPVIEAAGFTGLFVAPERPPPPRRPLQGVDMERELRILRDVFFGTAARERAPAMVELCGRWRPDVLVCDEADLGSMVAAERLGLPYATVIENATGGLVTAELVGEAMDALRAENGVPTGADAPLVLSPFRRACASGVPAARGRRVIARVARSRRGARLDGIAPRGSVLHARHGVQRRGGRPLRPRARWPTRRRAGRDRHRRHRARSRRAEAQPAHVHVAQYVPLGAALPHCAVVVSHGGSGSLAATLAHGLPSVLVPMEPTSPATRRAARRSDWRACST